MPDVLLSFGITDILGKTKRDGVWLPSGLTLAQYTAWSTAYQPIVDPVLDGFIKDVQVTFQLPLAEGDIKDTPNAGSRVRRGAEFLFQVPTAAQNYGVYLPSFLPSLIDAGFSTGTTPISTWLNAMIDGISLSGTIVQPTNGFSEDIAGFLRVNETFRK